MRYRARYYDGKSASPADADVILERRALRFRLADHSLSTDWLYEDVRIEARPEHNRPLVLMNQKYPHARLVVEDGAAYATVKENLPRTNKPLLDVPPTLSNFILFALAAVLVVAAVIQLSPRISDFAARHFPQKWELALGDYAVNAMTQNMRQCDSLHGQEALDKLMAHLVKHSGLRRPVIVQVVDGPEINAFAAPGGRIVIFSPMLARAEHWEELAGILAHETGHLVRRHSLRTLVRALGMTLVVSITLGDMATAATVANEVLQLSYSRDFEEEADREAVRIMRATGINPAALARLFERNQQNFESDYIHRYLSSHPMVKDRIVTLKKATSDHLAAPLLSAQEWEDLRNICVSSKTPVVEAKSAASGKE